MKRPVLLAMATLLVLPLAACSKPAPLASVVSGMSQGHEEAICWAFDSDAIDPAVCGADALSKAVAGGRVPHIAVLPGATVGISVDPVVAETGWFPSISGQRLTQEPITTTYYRFTFPEFQQVPAEGVTLEVIAGADDKTRGIWVFALDVS